MRARKKRGKRNKGKADVHLVAISFLLFFFLPAEKLNPSSTSRTVGQQDYDGIV